MKKVDITGKRFGLWTVLGFSGVKNGQYLWRCRCDCGGEKDVIKQNLMRGLSSSCGCAKPEKSRINATTHGMSKTQEYRIWSGMHTRCYNPKEKCFRYYGARGIAVSDDWKSFEAFYRDMGPRPAPGFSIERNDTNGNYCKDNCKWIPLRRQAWNTRSNRLHTIGSDTKCIAEWCHDLGLPYRPIIDRMERGHTFDEAVSMETQRSGPTRSVVG